MQAKSAPVDRCSSHSTDQLLGRHNTNSTCAGHYIYQECPLLSGVSERTSAVLQDRALVPHLRHEPLAVVRRRRLACIRVLHDNWLPTPGHLLSSLPGASCFRSVQSRCGGTGAATEAVGNCSGRDMATQLGVQLRRYAAPVCNLTWLDLRGTSAFTAIASPPALHAGSAPVELKQRR